MLPPRTFVLGAAALFATSLAPSFAQGPFVPLWPVNDGAFNPYESLVRGLEAAAIGEEVASLGDVNGDGISDFVTGDRVSNSVYIYSGDAQYDWTTFPAYAGTFPILHEITPSTDPCVATGWFGFDVANGFDLDLDQVDDAIVGAAAAQSVFVISGATGDVLVEIDAPASAGLVDFGFDVAGLGDVDQNGRPDIVVGTPSGAGGGSVFVYLGETLMANAAAASNGACGHPVVGHSTADQILTTPAGYDPSQATFGTCVASAGDTDGDGSPDGLMIGAPGTKFATGPNAGTLVGAVYVYAYDSGGPAPFALRELPDTSPMVFEGIGTCALLGFDITCAGDLDLDGIDDYFIGAMGRFPGAGDGNPDLGCGGPTPWEDGYADVYSGADGDLIGNATGFAQAGDKSRYGAYVTGDIDLDGDPTDCDIDGDLVPDLVISSYRRKLEAINAAPNWGSLRLYSGYHAGCQCSHYPSWLIHSSWAHENLVFGGGTMDGRFPQVKFGEALAFLPRESSADYPRIASFEGDIGTRTKIISPFGAIEIPLSPAQSSGDDPALSWRSSTPGSGQPWFDGELVVTPSSTSGNAVAVWVVPSLGLSNVQGPGGIQPWVVDGYPVYTLFQQPPVLWTASATEVYRMDFDSARWIDLTASASGSTPITEPFDLGHAAMDVRFGDEDGYYDLASDRGSFVFLQVIEVYFDPTASPLPYRIKASNLLICKVAPDAP